jgi:cell envelope opacity-associated protein A
MKKLFFTVENVNQIFAYLGQLKHREKTMTEENKIDDKVEDQAPEQVEVQAEVAEKPAKVAKADPQADIPPENRVWPPPAA